MSTTDSSEPLLLEACVETLSDALAAERRGAHRIELCSALDQDGLTPLPALLRECVEALRIPVMTMIRPRGGGFVYSAPEVAAMERDIATAKAMGTAGVVFGLLTPDGAIDVDSTERLARAASPLSVTFHKAFDSAADLVVAFRTLNAIGGINRVLTSGGCASAWEGRDVLKALQAMPGRRIDIIAAGRLTPDNRQQLADYTGIRELHGKRIV